MGRSCSRRSRSADAAASARPWVAAPLALERAGLGDEIDLEQEALLRRAARDRGREVRGALAFALGGLDARVLPGAELDARAQRAQRRAAQVREDQVVEARVDLEQLLERRALGRLPAGALLRVERREEARHALLAVGDEVGARRELGVGDPDARREEAELHDALVRAQVLERARVDRADQLHGAP